MSSASEVDPMPSPDGDDGSTNDLSIGSHLEYSDGSVPVIAKMGSGRMSPVRARTMKEYDQQIAELQKENFSLKLRIYFLEDRMKTNWDVDTEDVFKENIELKVEVESLKKDLLDKQELLKKASSALSSVTVNHQVELQQAKKAGLADGKRVAGSEMEALQESIDTLQKELSSKTEEIEKMRVHSVETDAKLNDLLTVNCQLDSRWRQLERDKKELEMQLEMLNSAGKEALRTDKNEETAKDFADEVARKDRLIEQLRCALKAKDVIIQQVEEEKKETIKEVTDELEKKILLLQAKVIDSEMSGELTVIGRPLIHLRDRASASDQKQRSSSAVESEMPQNAVDAAVQTSATEQTDGLNEEMQMTLNQQQSENEKLKKELFCRSLDIDRLKERLEEADQTVKDQSQQIKDLRDSVQLERQTSLGKILQLDVQYKSLLDDAQQHSANQDQTILRLAQNVKQKGEQLDKLLQLSDGSNITQTNIKVTEIFRELKKENEVAIQEVIEENGLSLKSKNDEIGRLKRNLLNKMEEMEKMQQDLDNSQQTIEVMKRNARSTDLILQRIADAINAEQQKKDDSHGRDISRIEFLVRQIQNSLLSFGLQNTEQASENVSRLSKGGDEASSKPEDVAFSAKMLADFGEDASDAALLSNSQAGCRRTVGTPLTHLRLGVPGPEDADVTMTSLSRVDAAQQTDNILDDNEKSEVVCLMAEVKRLKRLVGEFELGQKALTPCKEAPMVSQEAGALQTQSTKATMEEDEVRPGFYSVLPDKNRSKIRKQLISSAGESTLETVPNDSMLSDPTVDFNGLSPGEVERISSRELRLTSPRSNICYLSVESSKRWSADDGILGLQMPLGGVGKTFQALVPDESALSEMLSVDLHENTGRLSGIQNETEMLTESFLQEADISSTLGCQLLQNDSSRFEDHEQVISVEWLKQLEVSLADKERKIAELNGELEDSKRALSQSAAAIRSLEGELLESYKNQEYFVTLQSELSRVKEDLESSERANHLLQEQIKLNAKVDQSSISFNPELIVQLSKEIDRMKKEIGKGTSQILKVDKAVSTDIAYDREDRRSLEKQLSGDESLRDLKVSSVENENPNVSVNSRRGSSQQKSPNTQPQSEDGEGAQCTRGQCVKLQTVVWMLQSRVEDLSKQVAYYQDQQKDLGRKSPDDKSAPETPASVSHLRRGAPPLGEFRAENGDKQMERRDLRNDDVIYLLEPNRHSLSMPSGDLDMSLDARRSSGTGATPFTDIKAANEKELRGLRNEVRQLKAQLKMRDNSSLNYSILSNRDGTFCIPEMSPLPLGVAPDSRRQSAWSEEFLRGPLESLKRDNSLLLKDLELSQLNYNLLRTRLEELLEYLENQQKDTDTSFQFSALKVRLEDTRGLISDVSQSLSVAFDNSKRMSLAANHLVPFDVDADSSFRTENGEPSNRLSFLLSANRDLSKISELGEADLELRHHVELLERECGRLEQRLHQKEHELEQRLHQKEHELEQRVHLKELELASVASEAADSRTQLSSLWKEVETLRCDLEKEKQTNCLLRVELGELRLCEQSLQNTLEQCRHQMEEQSMERSRLDKECCRLRTALSEYKSRVNDLELDLATRESDRLEELRQTKEDHLRMIEDFERERMTFMTKIELMATEIQQLKIEVVRERDQAVAAEVTKKTYLEKIQDRDAEIRKLRELVKDNRKTAEDLRTQLHRINEDLQEKKRTIRRLSQKCQDLQSSTTSRRLVGSDDGDSGQENLRLDSVDQERSSGLPEPTLVDQLTTAQPGSKSDDPPVFIKKFNRATDEVCHNIDRLDLASDAEAVDQSDEVLRLKLSAAEEMITILKKELRLFRLDRSQEESSLQELLEIQQLRSLLEQSLKKNDQLRELLKRKLKENGQNFPIGDDSADGASDLPAHNGRQLVEVTEDLKMTKKEIEIQESRLRRLRSDLRDKIVQLESLEAQRMTVQQGVSMAKANIGVAQAETQRLKMALDESNELNRVLKMELRVMHEVKTNNKENEQGISMSPSRRSRSPSLLPLSDLITEYKELRKQFEKTIESNDLLRQELEELSRNKFDTTREKESVGSKAKSSSMRAVKNDADSTANGDPIESSDVCQMSVMGLVESLKGRSSSGEQRTSVGDSVIDGLLVFAVGDKDAYERLKAEMDRNQAAVGRLEKSIQAIHSEVIEDDRKKDLRTVVQELRSAAKEQTRLITLFTVLSLSNSDEHASLTAKTVENEILRKQLNDLRERYARAKHAMKAAQQRLDANNRHKEEFYTNRNSRKDDSMQQQITKTVQILVQSRQNLESFHSRNSSGRSSPHS